MIWLSLSVLLLMCLLHLPSGHSADRPISLEVADGNPLAWLLMLGLCRVVCVFAHRLKKSGHTTRTALLLLDAVGILVIALSPPDSQLHEGILAFVAILTIMWFIIMALGYDCRNLSYLSAATVLVLLGLTGFSLGLAEKGLILYCLVTSNLFYYNHLQNENAAYRHLW